MSKIKGITVKLFDKVHKGENKIGGPIYEEVEILVDNVLISPIKSEEILNTLNLTGRKAMYELAIPKNDKNNWENKKVVFFDIEWKVIGIPLQGINDLIPLDWNKKVQVERYE